MLFVHALERTSFSTKEIYSVEIYFRPVKDKVLILFTVLVTYLFWGRFIEIYAYYFSNARFLLIFVS